MKTKEKKCLKVREVAIIPHFVAHEGGKQKPVAGMDFCVEWFIAIDTTGKVYTLAMIIMISICRQANIFLPLSMI